ncbi:PREDICTED: neuronal acetylcholine receptor subunit alpha-6 isoform X2 [Drosophila arizonae]|uniref:Neuronal acetylcholine receptor subunit alpha-6 isoform X2 n=1 Tax=Drosophila arizonae TaxID=7263 RepID=A0ABM1NX92_DROAR|nr:PREDICTED: neuronal acetylcholine receptor subunit alpha-6 isoform X2 [Drosophila arizonae]
MDSSSCLSLFVALIFLVIIKESCQGPHEKRLLNHLLSTYNTLERPVANESEPLEVKFGLTLQQIIDVDEKNQLLITNLWLSLEWNDYNLRWNETEYGGVKDLRITPNKLWKPDVLMYNSADEGFDGTYHTNIVVKHNGSCLYVPPGIFKSTCKIDITWFPFDDQHCEMKFGSWTYDGNQLDLVLNSEDGGDLSDFITNGEWYLLGTYFNCIMFMVASSVVLTVVVLNYHHRTADIHEMPPWIKSVFLQWLPWILRMGRPGRKITRKSILLSNRMKELELKERSSKSLLANVLDIDDDFRHTISGSQTAIGSSASFGRPTTVEEHHTAIGCNHKDLHLILKELQFITARMRKADDEAELISDWKFAAMVVDRFCLIVFTLFTIIATVTVLLSAPHIIVQ